MVGNISGYRQEHIAKRKAMLRRMVLYNRRIDSKEFLKKSTKTNGIVKKREKRKRVSVSKTAFFNRGMVPSILFEVTFFFF